MEQTEKERDLIKAETLINMNDRLNNINLILISGNESKIGKYQAYYSDIAGSMILNTETGEIFRVYNDQLQDYYKSNE